ncbi:phospho-sugar mutase [Caldalkalibacillus salinus]|uniref:phospho-sugar mutase n=1 Tax=Caldalkalibacillus salinus TaxID=2803787 RepID=UPI0019204821|nr:phospho-sugar mutase [Caldalkalibacillus salinus]
MEWKTRYEQWRNHEALDAELKAQLQNLEHDEAKQEEHFYQYIQFGTGGMRGELAPGTNRMNIYTVRRAAEGMARYIDKQGGEAKQRGVAIAYDSRYYSKRFAIESARTMGKYGIRTYIFENLRPTPELSFAVRTLNAHNGIVITASHNPPEYNGFKVYGEDGGQIPPQAAGEVIQEIESIPNELDIQVAEQAQLEKDGLLVWIGEDIDGPYVEKVTTLVQQPQVIQKASETLKIVFSPLHGTAASLVPRVLRQAGFKHVTTVEEQCTPDPEFSTVSSPNPEEPAAFEHAIELGKVQQADLLMATDPDADRMGVVCKGPDDEYVPLTGNQVGALMLHYLLSQYQAQGCLPQNGVMLKTIVTSELGRAIADLFHIQTIDTLTGFKYIGEKIKTFEQSGEHQFLFGYEESYGYLIGDFVRDKDAVQACLLIAEVAAHYHQQGLTLYDALTAIYEEVGYYKEGLESITLKGLEGTRQIEQITSRFRDHQWLRDTFPQITAVEDYQIRKRTWFTTGQEEDITLPQANVVKCLIDDDTWFCIRPSGTEPKIKCYFGVKSDSDKNSTTKLAQLKTQVMNQIELETKA